MTLFELRRLTRLWQRRLRLENWTIAVSFGDAEQMAGNLGTTGYDPRDLAADIMLLQGADDTRYADGGIEQTVIHELLHLVLHGDVEYAGEDVRQERSINVIADALYHAHRGRKRGK